MAKADRGRIERALRKPPPDIRIFVLHGPHESGSRALAALLGEAFGQDAERVDLAPATLKQDPALLADEAASRSLFGGARYIRIIGGGDDCLAAVTALLEAPVAGNVAVLIAAGALRRESKLLKLVLGSAAALVFASYPPDGAQAERAIAELAREAGLLLSAPEAQWLASACGGDPAIAQMELAKLAIYADVAADRPGPLPEGAIALLIAGTSEADFNKLADAVAGGAPDRLAVELRRFTEENIEGIAVLRPALRRLLAIAAARAGIDAPGARHVAGGFPGERERIERQSSHWDSSAIAHALRRLAVAERLIKAPGGAGAPIAEDALLATAREAARRR